MQLTIEKINLDLASPFSITGYTFTTTDTVLVTLTDDGQSGRGEAAGIYYLDETQDSMAADLERVRAEVEAGATREEVQRLLPAGGARNALDCAYWDLDAKKQGRSVAETLGLSPLKDLTTVYTIGIADAVGMARAAEEASAYPHLKIKLDAEDVIGRMKAIRAARPDASLIIDVNQGWTFDQLKEYTPALADMGVAMIEQPLARGGDEALEGYKSPVPLGADESCLHSGEYEAVARFYDVINIKLDKTGGLTDALKLADMTINDGKDLMVGNMMGSSLSMAPSFLIGQRCKFVDIDGPLLLKEDIQHGLDYRDAGQVSPPTPALWG